MNGTHLGRRRTVLGGLAAASLACLTMPSRGQAVTTSAGRADLGLDDEAVESAQEARHAPCQAEFLAQLGEAEDRFALPVAVDTVSPSYSRLRFGGVHEAVWVALGPDWAINVVAWWDDVQWGLLGSCNVAPERVPSGQRNALLIPKANVIHPSHEAIWRADYFANFVAWVNGTLAQVTHLAMWNCGHGATWAALARDGVLIRGGRPLSSGRQPDHLMTLHGWP